MKLFFDTETTGKADFKNKSDSTNQPRIVQLAALLTEDDGLERGSLNIIIKPDGWTISAEVAAVHGITQEIADRCGIPLLGPLNVFSWMCKQANELIAHNIDFDLLIVGHEFKRAAKPFPELKPFCTMHATTNICKLPGNYGKYKWPKLSEAYKHFFKEDLQNAHDAMADVRGCARIYFAL